MIGAGLLARKAVAKGLTVEAVGEDLARAGLAGGRRISREIRPAEGSRQARLQSRRLRLHHLHRQFRPAAGGNFQGDQRERSRRRRGALGQPQLRRPRQRRRARQLSRLAAAGRRLCDRRLDACRSRQARRSASTRRARRSSSRTSGRPSREIACGDPQVHHQADVREEIRRRVQGRRELAQDRGQGRPDLCLGRPFDLRAEPALLRRHGASGRSRSSDIVDARILGLFLDSITTDHISPAGSIKDESPAGKYLRRPPGASRRTSTSTARGAAITR